MCRKSETKVLVLCDLKESRYPYMVILCTCCSNLLFIRGALSE